MVHKKNLCSLTVFLAASLLIPGSARGAVEFFDLNTHLMRATFKIQGEGSCGTGFVLSHSREEGAECVRRYS